MATAHYIFMSKCLQILYTPDPASDPIYTRPCLNARKFNNSEVYLYKLIDYAMLKLHFWLDQVLCTLCLTIMIKFGKILNIAN